MSDRLLLNRLPMPNPRSIPLIAGLMLIVVAVLYLLPTSGGQPSTGAHAIVKVLRQHQRITAPTSEGDITGGQTQVVTRLGRTTKAIRKIDLIGCPNDFREAFEGYVPTRQTRLNWVGVWACSGRRR